MRSAIPSLTLDGWIENKNLQMTKLWEYFLASEYSQSNIFFGDISSLKYILATSDPKYNLITNLESTLTKLYQRYFDKAIADVGIDANSELNKYKVYITVTCNDSGKDYRLAKELTYSNGKIEKFEELLDNLYSQYSDKGL